MPADAGIRFGQYVLVRRIARGGMAEVFLAQQRGLEGFDRRVAVKRILPHLADSPDFVKMFLGEAKLAAQLSHPNVVHIYEFGKVDHDYFIAMEFVDGVHAGQVFKQGDGERLPATLVARIGADAANALHYAHELRGPNGKTYGLVHRDVSPANIMISYDGVVKLCDFGIAKAAAAGDQLTQPGQVKGKYAYMSPEQTIASGLDGRSDVFSLGVCLWELITGKYIVPRGDAVASMRMIRDGKIEPVERAAPNTPPALVKAINWALEPQREQRATASDLAQALEAFIKQAPDIGTSMQLGTWIRARFPRETTGQHSAIDGSDGAPSPTTSAGPGTMAVPGTHAGQPGTVAAPETSSAPMMLPVTPLMYPPRRVVKLVTEDSIEGTEIYSTSDLDLDSATIKSKPYRGGPPQYTPSAPTRVAPPDAEPTVQGGPIVVGEATEIVDTRHVPAPDNIDDSHDNFNNSETVLRDRRSPLPSGPMAVPTRVQPIAAVSSSGVRAPSSGVRNPPSSGVRNPPSGVRVPPSGPQLPPPSGPQVPPSGPHLHQVQESGMRHTLKGTGTQHMLPPRTSSSADHMFSPGGSRGPVARPVSPEEVVRARRVRKILMFTGLGVLALLSFMIALAASNSSSGKQAGTDAGTTRTSGITVAEVRDDAALPVAESPLDAEVAPIPTIPVDAGGGPSSMGLLVVRTIPDGGTVKVGDQVRQAAIQPGDPTGARTAQLLLDAGRYTIEAELAGYQPEKRDVMLDGGENKMIEITFTKKISIRPDRGPAAGRLTVRTTPWSDVYLGGKKLGQAPFADLELPVGTHTLTFKNPSRPTMTKTVTIKAGKLTKLNFSLP